MTGRPVGGPGCVFLVDAYNFIFRAYHALPMLNAPDGTPVNAVHGFVRMVQALRREFAPQYMVAIFDAGGVGHRHQMFEDYKANRSEPPDDLKPQFSLVREATDALQVPRVEQRGIEADDLIAAYTERAHQQGLRVVIVTSDKDLMQLVDDGDPSVVLWDTMKTATIGPAQVQERFGVLPDKLGDLLALSGDSSDNIPGVPGIGPKTAAALLGEYGDLEGVLAAAPQIKQKKRRERLIEHAEDARLSRRLVELASGVELPKPLEELADPGADEAKAGAFFEPLGFKLVIKEILSPPAAGRRSPRTAVAPVGDLQSAYELKPMDGVKVDAERTEALWATDDVALTKLAADLRSAARVVVHVAMPAGDAMRVDPVGFAFAWCGPDGEVMAPVYVPVGHRQTDLVSGKQLDLDAVRSSLGPVLSDSAIPKITMDHKTQALVLERHGFDLQGVVMDPMLASYVLDPARAAHSLDALSTDVARHPLTKPEQVLGKGRKAITLPDLDVEQTRPWLGEQATVLLYLGRHLEEELEHADKAFRYLFAEVEMPLARVLQRIERRGIKLDAAVLHAQSAELGKTIAEIQARVDAEAGYEVNVDSPIQLRKLLFDERGLPPTRKTKTGYSTDAKVLEELSLLDPIVRDILAYRSLTKLKGTYLDTLPELVNPDTKRLHTSFHQAVAQTGRLSSSDPNLQNIPIRTAEGRRIRAGFVAPSGRVLVALDYSQIELRVLAHLCGDPNLVSAFVEGVDVHRRTAAEVFGVPEDQVDSEQRRIAKAVNFGVIYGQTAFGLAQQLGIPRGKAGSYIRAYFERVPGVDAYMRELIAVAKGRGYAETILGRRRRIPELGRKGPARAHGERMARNTPIQGSAADILKLAMIAVERALQKVPWASMLLTVHDELIFECDDGKVEELIGLARPLMEGAFDLKVPLQVDAGWGKTWAECKG